jgi:prepilin-type N-terminal cleavage/methylation domain-containing protein
MRGKGGFTLIEIVLVVIVISVGLVGIMSLFEAATKGALQIDLNVIAVNLAHEKLEQVVSHKAANGYNSIASASYPNESFTGDFSMFTRNTAITEVASNDFMTLSPGSGYKKVAVTVRWGDSNSKRISLPTILSSY